MNITVKYQLSDSDLMNFYKFSVRYYPVLKTNAIILAGMAVFLAAHYLFIPRLQPFHAIVSHIIIVLMSIITLGIYQTIQRKKKLREEIEDGVHEVLFSPHQLTLGEETYTLITPTVKAEHRYQKLKEINSTKNLLLIIEPNGFTTIIPKQCFESDEQMRQLVDYFKTKTGCIIKNYQALLAYE